MVGGKRFHFVAYLNGVSIASAETKEDAMARAEETILGALACQNNQGIASVAADGTICTTREYAPGVAEFTYHRGIERFHGSFMGRLEIDGKRVTAREYHVHYVAAYNEAISAPARRAAYDEAISAPARRAAYDEAISAPAGKVA
jgi:hypothetical protein